MRSNFIRVFGWLFAFLLMSPAGYLLAIQPRQPVALSSATANWADTERATTLFGNIQDLAQKVRREVGPLQVQEPQLSWQIDASRLTQIKSDVNKMSNDLAQLSSMRKKLEPWQQQLLKPATRNVHELVYQTEAAIKMLDAQHDMLALSGGNYPQALDIISHSAHKVSSAVGTYTQYAQAAQQLAGLHPANNTRAQS